MQSARTAALWGGEIGERGQAMRMGSAAMAVFLAATIASAEEGRPFAGDVRYEKYTLDYEVSADGTYTERHDWALRVLTDQGVRAANDVSIRFSDQLQDAHIEQASTEKRDGRRIEAPAANFQEESTSGRGDAPPMFSDVKTKTVVFPEVGVGDTVHLRYRIRQKEAVFPGHFSILHAFSRFFVYDDVTVTVSAPASIALRVQARGVEGGEIGVENGRRRWRWTFRNPAVRLPEPAAVSPIDDGAMIAVTSFASWAELAAAYDARAQPKAAVTAATRTLARSLAEGATTPRERARRLYEWVADNVRFARGSVGVGSVVPHDVDRVLENRLGDCKDHVALLQSLLAAVDIESTPALINSGTAFTLPEVPSPSVFDHVILYVPSLDLYLDSTARFTPFGALPEADRDKPVIHTHGFRAVRHTPGADYRENRARSRTTLRIHPDGSADGETDVEVSGEFATSVRSWLNDLTPNAEDVTVRRVLAVAGYAGSGTLRRPASSARSLEAVHYGGRYRIDDALTLPGPGAWSAKSPFASAAPIEGFLRSLNDPLPTGRFSCYGGISSETIVLELPKGVRVLALPKDVEVTGKNASYRATYRAHGTGVTVEREIQDRTRGNVCGPQAAIDFKPVGAAALRDLRAQILYEATETATR